MPQEMPPDLEFSASRISPAHLAAVVDQAIEPVFLADVHGRLVFANPAFTAITGHDRGQAMGQSITDLLPNFPPLDPEADGTWQGQFRTSHRDGAHLHLDGTLTPIRDPEGRVIAFAGLLRNVTQEVESERNLRRLQKMEALGALASGVAHDSNNILAAILGAAELIEWQAPPDSPIPLKLQVIYQAVRRAQELNRQILSFCRNADQKQVPFDLSAVVKEAIYLLRSTFPATVEVQTRITSGLWIMGDPNQLHQVVMNLSINALQALPAQGGSLELSVDEEAVGDLPLPSQPAELLPGRYAVLSVTDTGCGMDSATLDRAFEPFFTTKAAQESSGLGLPVVHGIVCSHNGAMTVQSVPDQGTTFRVFLPCTTHEAPVGPEPPQDPAGGMERILLVDDEEVLGALAKQGLQILGYQVTARSSSQEALAEFQRRPNDFDMLITDLAMPGLSGVELTGEIRKRRPDFPAILITGAFQAPSSMEGIATPFDEIIFKPIAIHDMARSVRKIFALKPVNKPAAAPAMASEGGSTASLPVLLAEDSSVTRGLLRSWLAKAGYRVQVARDGQEAWEAFMQARETEAFGLVLTDIVMPRMDGLQLTARIREVDGSVPIVILSTSEDADSAKKAIHLHVNEFLTKPFESAVLIDCVERMSADHAKRLKGLRSVETAQAVRMAQRAMEAVPEKDMPIYSISEPLTDAGGDVFRCHRVAGGAIFFAIADVAGHSVISSYAVASYLAILSNFLGECIHLRPAQERPSRYLAGTDTCSMLGSTRCEPLKHLALKLNHTIQTGPFAEVPICSLFGLWDPGTGRVQLLNAGIPHAQWFRRNQGRTCPVEINGTPLGILDEPLLEEKVIAMEPGDRLLLGSDGFFEAPGADRSLFEPFARTLWRDLSCTDILTAVNLVSESARVHASGQFTDDLLVVGFEQPELPADARHFAACIQSDPAEIDRVCQDLEVFLKAAQDPAPAARRFEILLAVREALSNAIFHGNPPGGSAHISVTCGWNAANQLQIGVLDEGQGFDLDGHQPPDTRYSERGRGLPIIQNFAREVVMTGGELLMTF